MKHLITLAMLVCLCPAVVVAQNPVTATTTPTVVVAHRSFTGRTSNIQQTVLFTPASTGIFRVTVDVEESDTSDASPVEPFISWTSDFTVVDASVPLTVNQAGVSASASGQITIRAHAGTPIQLIALVDPKERGTYNLYVVIEKL